VRVGRDQLLRTFYSDYQLHYFVGIKSLPDWHDSRQEITHLDGVIPLGVEEIQTIPLFIDVVGIPESQLSDRIKIQKLTCERYASRSTAPTTRTSSCA
jgi:hypothetical protein